MLVFPKLTNLRSFEKSSYNHIYLFSSVFVDCHKFFRFDSTLDSRSSLSIINYGETLYGWWEYTDYVLQGFGEKEIHPKYKGIVEKGAPNGLGYLIYTYGSRYFRRWRNGEMNGQGTFTTLKGKSMLGNAKTVDFET